MNSRIPRQLIFTVLAFGGMLGMGWLWSPSSPEVIADAPVPLVAARGEMPAPATKQTKGAEVQAAILERDFRPRSLAGTQEDGRLTTDTTGRLVRDRALRDRIDYWLTSLGELDVNAIRARLIHEAQQTGGEATARDMADLLDRYLAYLDAANELLSNPAPARGSGPEAIIQSLSDTLDSLHGLRVSYLGPETASAFFADEEAYGAFTIETMKVRTNRNLSANERERALRQAREQLPEGLKEVVASQEATNARISAGLEAMQKARSETELDALLQQAGYDEAARQRAITTWQQEREFDQAYSGYRKAVEQLQAQTGLAPEDRASQQENLLRTWFRRPEARQRALMRDRTHQG